MNCCFVKNQPETSCDCDYMSLTAPTFIENAAHLIGQSFVNNSQLGQSKSINFTCQKSSEDDKSLAYMDFISAVDAVTAGKLHLSIIIFSENQFLLFTSKLP